MSISNESGSQGAAVPSVAVLQCLEEMKALEQQYPEWFADYEDAMTDVVASRAEIESLLATAPTDLLRGLLFGTLKLRIQISFLTGREF